MAPWATPSRALYGRCAETHSTVMKYRGFMGLLPHHRHGQLQVPEKPLLSMPSWTLVSPCACVFQNPGALWLAGEDTGPDVASGGRRRRDAERSGLLISEYRPCSSFSAHSDNLNDIPRSALLPPEDCCCQIARRAPAFKCQKRTFHRAEPPFQFPRLQKITLTRHHDLICNPVTG